MRGRVISRNELIFQLANVTGAAIAVLVYPGPRVGFAAVAVVLILGGITYASQLRMSLRKEAGRWLLGQSRRADNRALPLALLAEAIRFAEQGDRDVSVVVAAGAVRTLVARTAVVPASQAQVLWDSLAQTVDAVMAGTKMPAADDTTRIINAAAALIAERSFPAGDWSAKG
jgi:hypothetical protein